MRVKHADTGHTEGDILIPSEQPLHTPAPARMVDVLQSVWQLSPADRAAIAKALRDEEEHRSRRLSYAQSIMNHLNSIQSIMRTGDFKAAHTGGLDPEYAQIETFVLSAHNALTHVIDRRKPSDAS